MSPRRLITPSWWGHVRRDYLTPGSWIFWLALFAVLSSIVVPVAIWINATSRDSTAEAQKEFNAELCVAIPNVAAASSQALANVLIRDARQQGRKQRLPQAVTDAKIANIRRLAPLLQAEARRLALRDLPSCPPPSVPPAG